MTIDTPTQIEAAAKRTLRSRRRGVCLARTRLHYVARDPTEPPQDA